MDSHCKELELNAELVVCLNKAKAIKAIKEAEVCHTATIKEANVCHTVAIKKAEVHHAVAIKEAKVFHTTAIKEVKVCCITTACVLQKTCRENMLMLEHEVKAEEGWDHQAIMKASGTVL